MDENNFRKDCKKVVEFICEYMRTVPDRRIKAEAREKYLLDVIPKKCPEKSLEFDSVLEAVQEHLLPGLVQWRHPHYFGYWPSGGSYASILANMLAATVNGAGFSWASCPTISELETIVLDWLCKMLGLPDLFLSSKPMRGGGALQMSPADATLSTLFAARSKKMRELKRSNPAEDRRLSLPSMVAYCSALSYDSVKRAAEVAMVRLRPLEVDEEHRLRGATLEAAMRADVERGLAPAYVWAGLGSNPYGACDALAELGPLCEEFGAWLHVDAAYAGAACVCPELRAPLTEVPPSNISDILRNFQSLRCVKAQLEVWYNVYMGHPAFDTAETEHPPILCADFATSFCVDPSLWLLINFDCCALWVSNRRCFVESFIVDPLYMAHAFSDQAVDFRHWGLPLSRRFRSLKVWFVIKYYGIEGLQQHIREQIRLAKVFEALVRGDIRFEVVNEVQFGVVCFRQVGCNELNLQLLGAVNLAGRCFLVGVTAGTRFMLRFCVSREGTTEEDVVTTWYAIKGMAQKVKSLHEAISHKCQ